MNSPLAALALAVSLMVAPPPLPTVGDCGVRPGVGPGIQPPPNVPATLQPGSNGVRPSLGPPAGRLQPPAARPATTTPPRSLEVKRPAADVRTTPRR